MHPILAMDLDEMIRTIIRAGKALQKEALELTRAAKATMKAANVLLEASHKARELQIEAENALEKVEAFRLGSRTFTYGKWRRSRPQKAIEEICLLDGHLREGGKTRNVH